MSKGKFFSGQPVFGQLLNFIPDSVINRAVNKYNSDYYTKTFDTKAHLTTMLFASYSGCTSLREVVTSLSAYQEKVQHLGLTHLPTRSTLSDANSTRSYEVFEKLFLDLRTKWMKYFPDSQVKDDYIKNLLIMDSTTITLCKEIMKGAGIKDKNGKRKGGIKVHMTVRAQEDIPGLIRFTPAAACDKDFMKQVNPPAGTILVFDKGYNDYSRYIDWKAQGVDWVTRINSRAIINDRVSLPVTDEDQKAGVISDEQVLLGYKAQKKKVICRLITFYDSVLDRIFQFISSSTTYTALQIADIYKRRWQIELLFKRLKQNMPLMNFLGDNENAIKIQIYCALIADLLLKIIMKGAPRLWYYSNVASLTRILLLSYFNLQLYLVKHEYKRIKPEKPPKPIQMQFC